MKRTNDKHELEQKRGVSSGGEGDEEQLNSATVSRLFHEHNKALIGYLAARLHSEQEARDVAQEAYVRLLRLHKRGTPSLIRAYLFKTARNLAIDRLRRRIVRERLTQTDELCSEASNPEYQALAEEQTRQLMQYLQELPRRCQDVFRLHRLEELDQREVARRLGLSDRMVRRYVTYAMIYCRLRLNGESIDAVKRQVIL